MAIKKKEVKESSVIEQKTERLLTAEGWKRRQLLEQKKGEKSKK